jgi:hypothetical protein
LACWRRRPSTGTAPDGPLTAEDRLEHGLGDSPLPVDQTTFRSFQNRSNNYGLDRQAQKTESYSGSDGINQQDRALQESMAQSSTAAARCSARPTRRSSRPASSCARR